MSSAEQQEIALTLAKKYIDLNEYKMDIIENEESHTRLFAFVKHLDGIETREKLYIYVNKYGEITNFVSSMLGMFPQQGETLSKATERQLHLLRSDQAKKQAIEHAIASTKHSEDVTNSSTEEEAWVLLEDDTWGVLYVVELETSTENAKSDSNVKLCKHNEVRVLVK